MTTTFINLPKEVQEQVKTKLGCYDKCYVDFENGKYKVSTSVVLTASKNADDYQSYGTFYKSDVLTEDEQIIAYVNNFREYPSQYKGKRDYAMLNKMREIGWDAKVKFDENRNLVLV